MFLAATLIGWIGGRHCLRIGASQERTFLLINVLCFCTTWQYRKHGNCICSLNAVCSFAKRHEKYIEIIT